MAKNQALNTCSLIICTNNELLIVYYETKHMLATHPPPDSAPPVPRRGTPDFPFFFINWKPQIEILAGGMQRYK